MILTIRPNFQKYFEITIVWCLKLPAKPQILRFNNLNALSKAISIYNSWSNTKCCRLQATYCVQANLCPSLTLGLVWNHTSIILSMLTFSQSARPWRADACQVCSVWMWLSYKREMIKCERVIQVEIFVSSMHANRDPYTCTHSCTCIKMLQWNAGWWI